MNYYVYRHRRLDTNKVFYVGLGQGNRAYSERNRNTHWKNIASKGYSIEILVTDLSKEKACELEIFLISLYGRKDLGTGCLVNMTDGGDGTANIIWSEKRRQKMIEINSGVNHPNYGKRHSELHKQRIGDSVRGYKHTDKSKKLISDKAKQRVRGNNNQARIVLDTQTGIFFECAKDAAEAYEIHYRVMIHYLNGTRKNKTNLKYV